VQASDIQMAGLIAANSDFNRVINQYPLDVYNTAISVASEAADCSVDPAVCLAQCKAGNATACFNATPVAANENSCQVRTYPQMCEDKPGGLVRASLRFPTQTPEHFLIR